MVPLADGEPFAAAKAGKFLRAYRILGVSPVIDGRLDDEVWALAGSMDDLVQWEPNNMAPPSERTVTQVAFDDRNLYVAIRLFDRSADGVTAGLGRRDDFPPTDQISVGFDPRHDHQTAYIFQTNPSGVQGDMRRFDDTRIDRDYDAVWRCKLRSSPKGGSPNFRSRSHRCAFLSRPMARPCGASISAARSSETVNLRNGWDGRVVSRATSGGGGI